MLNESQHTHKTFSLLQFRMCLLLIMVTKKNESKIHIKGVYIIYKKGTKLY